MSQATSRPRFYINMLDWYNSQGMGNPIPDVLRTLPVKPELISTLVQSNVIPLPSGTNKFIALLGHDLASSGFTFRLCYNNINTFN